MSYRFVRIQYSKALTSHHTYREMLPNILNNGKQRSVSAFTQFNF